MIDYPKPAYLCMTDRGGIPADLSDGVGKVYNLCRVEIYSNSRVLGYGRLIWLLPNPMSSFGFIKCAFGKERIWCRLGVLGGYCRGTEVIRSTCRVLPKVDGGHV
jgi:hypothetical protein